MIRDLGTVKPGTTLYIPFHTFDSNDPSASVTLTGLLASDIEVYKDGSTTQRASDSGYALLDTDGIDFDTITGIHGISIDLADNTTAGFWAAGSQYWVVISSVTVDAATINFILCTFKIGLEDAVLNTTIATLSSQTSFTLTTGPAEDDALNGCIVYIHDVASAVQGGFAVVQDYTGSTKTVTLTAGTTFTAAATDNISFFPPSNAAYGGSVAYSTTRGLAGTALPNAAAEAAGGLFTRGTGAGQINQAANGQIDANTVALSGDSIAADNLENAYDDTAGAVPWAGIVDQGTAQSATGTTLVLRSAAAFADDELLGATIVITGGSAGIGQRRVITDYVSSTDTATVDTWTTTPSGTITYKIFGSPPAPASGTLPGVNVVQISGDAAAADNAEAFFDGTGYAGTNNVIPTVTTLTNLPAITANWLTAAGTAADFGTEVGTAVWASATRTLTSLSGLTVDTVTTLTNLPAITANWLTAAGTAADFGTEVATAVWALATRTLTAGTNIDGSTFTAIPWNASWDAEVQSEVQDAIEVNHLDHFIAVADPGGVVANSSFLAKLVSKSATPAFSSYDNTTDSHEALRDRGDAAWTTATGFSTHSAADVWAAGTRTLTAGTNINGSTFTAIPWNAAWDAEVESEVADALATTIPDSIPADGTRPSVNAALYMLCQGFFEGSISGTTWTIKKVDGSTTLFTVTLNDATTPTGKTRAT